MTFDNSRSKGLLRLRHLQETTEAVGEEMDRERLRFDALRDGEPTRAVSAFNLFQTPESICDRMVRAIGPLDGMRVLEPSAGLGRIYRAVRCLSDCGVVLVEQAPQCAAELFRETVGDDACRLIQDDFLTCTADRLGGLFDVVLMNPPFKNGTDIKHVRHALSLLKPQGRLISLCYAGTKQTKAFRNHPDWEWTDLEPGSFRAEGTGANVAMIQWRE